MTEQIHPDEQKGHAAAQAAEATQHQVEQPAAIATGARPPTVDPIAALDAYVHSLLYAMLRGAMFCVPNFRPESVLLSFCRVLGHLVGSSYVGEVQAVNRFRQAAREGFRDEMQKVPTQAMPPPPATAQTAVKPPAA